VNVVGGNSKSTHGRVATAKLTKQAMLDSGDAVSAEIIVGSGQDVLGQRSAHSYITWMCRLSSVVLQPGMTMHLPAFKIGA
jgi:hypothetical protein